MASKYDQWIAIAEASQKPATVGDLPVAMYADAVFNVARIGAKIADDSNRAMRKVAVALEMPENSSQGDVMAKLASLGDDFESAAVDAAMEEFLANAGSIQAQMPVLMASAELQVWATNNSSTATAPRRKPDVETASLSLATGAQTLTIKSRFWDKGEIIVAQSLSQGADGTWRPSATASIPKSTQLPVAFAKILESAVTEWKALAAEQHSTGVATPGA